MGYLAKKGDVILYGVEGSYGSAAATARVFGIVDEVTEPTYDRQIETKHAHGSANPQYYEGDLQKYTGGAIVVTNQRPEFWEYIIGASSDSGAGPYDHTLDPDDNVSSLTIAIAKKDTAGTVVVKKQFVGSCIGKLKVTGKKGSVVKSEINFDCQKVVNTSDSLTFSIQANEEPICFKGVTVEVDSTAISTINDWEWTFERALNSTDGNNSTLIQHMSADDWTSTTTIKYAYTQQDEEDWFHGASGGTQDQCATSRQITVTVTNGEAGTAERTIVLDATSGRFSTFQYTGYDGHLIAQLVSKNKSIQVVTTDNTADWA